MILIIEGMAMCFILLMVCVIGIAKDGPVGLVCFYEKDVQDRVVELGLTTQDRIKRSALLAATAVTIPALLSGRAGRGQKLKVQGGYVHQTHHQGA